MLIDFFRKLHFLLPANDKYKLAGLFLMMLLASTLEVVGVGFIPVFVSIIAQPDWLLQNEWVNTLFEAVGVTTQGDMLVFGALFLIFFFSLKNAYLVFYTWLEGRYIYNRYLLIGNKLFLKYLNAPYEFKLNKNTSVLLRNVTQETGFIAAYILTPFLKLTMGAVLIISISVLLFIVEPIVTISVISLFGLGGGYFVRYLKVKLNDFGIAAQTERESMIRTVNETFGGYKEIFVLNRGSWFYRRFNDQMENYTKSLAFRYVTAISTKPVVETVTISGVLFIALLLYWQGKPIETVLPILTLFGAAMVRLLPSIRNFIVDYTNLRYYGNSIIPVVDDIHELSSQSDSDSYNDLTQEEHVPVAFESDIEFDDICFRYKNSTHLAVNHLNLKIPKGLAVGIVGESGSGKTTLIDVLLGLLPPSSGRILVDGEEIMTNSAGWQRQIGYIPQTIYLSDDTIKQNIAFGLPDDMIDTHQLEKAVEAAQLESLISSLPNGLDTIVGENGARLSGGQRQRIGIARALYHEPEILIMDEATASLDNITEKSLVEAIEKLKGTRTVIMIAHRMSTVRNCDRLYMLKEGKIIAEGNFEELLKYSKEFKQLTIGDTK